MIRRKNRRPFLYAFAVLAALISSQPAIGEEIVLGMSAAFTGPSRGLGIELYRGSMAYFEHVNRQGGVHGQKIVIKARDDGYNPRPAISNTIDLLQNDKVFLLYNYVGTPTTTRCLPLLKRHQDDSVFLFFPFSGAEPQRNLPYGDFVFNLRASYYQETSGLVNNFVDVGHKKIAVFYQIDAYGRNGWEGVRGALKNHGLRIAAEATYRRGASYKDSMKEQVDLLRASDADAVISIGAYAACAAFIRDARDAGWDVPIANVSFVGSENMLNLLLKTGDEKQFDYTKNLINSQVVPSYNEIELPAVKEYREFINRYNPQPPVELLQDEYQTLRYSFVALEGFLNAKLLVAVLEKMGPPFKRERLRTAAESIDRLDLGIGSPVGFSKTRHQASDKVYYTVVHDKRFETLKDWSRWRK